MPDTIKIIENGYVFSCDSERRSGKLAILIKADRIAEVSTRAEALKSLYPSAEVINAEGKVVFPGFIDAHHHGESALLQVFTALVPYSQWEKDARIRKITQYLLLKATAQELSKLYRLAYFSALKSGVTTLAEYGLDTLDSSFGASYEALRRADLRGFIGVHNGEQIGRARTLRHPSVRFMVGMPGEDDLTMYNLQTTMRSARELQWPLVIHYGETRREFETLKRNFRKSVVQILEEFHLLGFPHQLTHLACLESKDFEILARSGTSVILCPRSALEKETDIPPVHEFLEQRVPLALGTDWGTPDPFANIRALITILELTNRRVPNPMLLLEMHTTGAARALGLNQEVGSIEAGKKADITIVGAADVRLQPFLESNDHKSLLNLLLRRLTSRDVSDVMINGEFFVRQNQIMTYAEEDLIREAKDLVRTFSSLTPSTGVRESSPPASPTIPFVPRTERTLPIQSDDGFQIIRKSAENSAVKGNVLPLHPDPPVEVSKEIKKTFGDDEL